MKMRKDEDIKAKSIQNIHAGEKLIVTEIMSQRKESEKRDMRDTKIVLTPSEVNVSHLQFNLPDGSTFAQDFKSTICLQEVVDYIKNSLNLRSNNIILSITSPAYREFTRDDHFLNLLDLRLAPNAVFNVAPLLPIIKEADSTRSRIASETVTTTTRSFFLFAFFYAIYSFVARLLFGAPVAPVRIEESRPILTIVSERESDEIPSAIKRQIPTKGLKKQTKTMKGDESSEKTSTSTGGSAKSSKSSKSLTKLIRINHKDKVKMFTADP